MTRGQLSGRQLFWMAFLLMFPTMLLLLPGDLLRAVGRFAWWTPLVAMVPATLLCGGIGTLGRYHGGLGQAGLRGLGPRVGVIPLVVVWCALGVYCVVVTREYGALAVASFVFEDVPLALLTILGLLVAGLAAYLGPVIMARGAEVVGPLMLIVTILLMIAALPFAHVLWALPLLPRSAEFARFGPVGESWVWLLEPLATMLLLDQLQPTARRGIAAALGGAIALAAVVTSLGLWVMVADFGRVRAATFVLPFFDLSKDLTYGSFLQHLEVLLIPVTLLGGVGKMAIFYWLFARSGALCTGMDIRLWLVVGLVLIGWVGIVAFPSVATLSAFLRSVLEFGAMPALATGIGVIYGAAALPRRARHR